MAETAGALDDQIAYVRSGGFLAELMDRHAQVQRRLDGVTAAVTAPDWRGSRNAGADDRAEWKDAG